MKILHAHKLCNDTSFLQVESGEAHHEYGKSIRF